jgi:PAS domain S-box-containing protein
MPGPREHLPYLAELLDLAPVGVLVRSFGVDSVVYWSHGAEELYGWTAEEAFGQVTHTLLSTRFPESKEAVDEALAQSGQWSGELVHTRRDGAQVVVASRQAVQRDEHGRPTATLEINTDITVRKRIEEGLRESEERFRLLVENVRDCAIFLVSADGHVVTWNEGAQSVNGYRPDEIIGQPITRFYTPDDLERGLPPALLAKADAEGRAEDEGWRVRRDGSTYWADVVITALRDDQHRLRGFATVTRDLTERRQAEEARAQASREEGARIAAEAAQAELRASREQLAATLAGVAEGITVLDTTGRMLFANDAAARLCGFTSADELLAASPAEILGRFELFDDAGLPLPRERLPGRRALLGQQLDEVLVRFRMRATGEERWSVVNASPIVDAVGRVIMEVSIFRDVTERKRAEDAAVYMAAVNLELTRSLDYEQTLKRVAELTVPTLADWCIIDLIEPDGTLRRVAVAHPDADKMRMAMEVSSRYPASSRTDVGPAHVARTGRTEIVPVITDEQIKAGARDADHLAFLRSLQLRSAIIAPLVGRGRALGALTLIAAESGRQFSARDLAVVEDLALRAGLAVDNARLYREAQEMAAVHVELNALSRDAMSQLQQALQTRDEFLASASHDLKSPVAAIKATAQLLHRRLRRWPQLDVQQFEEGLARIDAIATRAADQVDELLDVTRLQMGHSLDLDRQEVDVIRLVQDAVDEHQSRSERHQLIFVAGTPELIGFWDGRRLARVVANLLDNAIKYSPEGGLVRIDASSQGGFAVLSVEDHGVGIPEPELERIFERFERGTNVLGRIGGTGIGLASARHIVESHGGSISATSHPASGTTFTVRLPLQ